MSKGTAGKWPEECSYNNGFNPDWGSLTYMTVKEAANRIARLELGSQLSNDDIKTESLQQYIADILEGRAKFEGISRILHCLDDYLIISEVGLHKGSENLQALLAYLIY